MRMLLLPFTVLAAVPLLAGQADLENFLDAGPKKPAPAKTLPPGAKVLLAPKAKIWNPVWFPDGQRVACLSDEPGEPVWIVNISDGTRSRFGRPGVKSSLTVLADVRPVFVAGRESHRTVHLLSFPDGLETVLGKAWNPAASRDGNELACDTAQGPMVCVLNQAQPRGIKIPLSDAPTVEDGYPRFLSDGTILCAHQGHIYRWDRKADKPQRIAAQNMHDLTFYQCALPSPDGRLVALFSTNASALSKPPSTWLMPLAGEGRTPRELCLGLPVGWIDDHTLLVLRAGSLCRVAAVGEAKAESLAEDVAGAAVSPDGKRLAIVATIQDSNVYEQIDWRDGTSLLLRNLP